MSFVVTVIAHGDALRSEKELVDRVVGALDAELIKTETLSKRAVDIFVKAPGEVLQLKQKLDQLDVDGADLAVQVVDEQLQRRPLKLCVFDMDSTLIYQEVIELIAAYAGVEPQVHEITERAMNNEIDFKQSLRERVRLLKGLKIDNLYEEIKQKLQITEGVPKLCSTLKQHGIKLAVLSGGFIQFASYIKDQLSLDYARANLLEMDDSGVLTGEVIGEIVDGQCKAETIKQLCRDWSIDLGNVCMIGDGGNDLPSMHVSGYGIAWNAKPTVQKQAPSKLNTKSLADALYIFGIIE